MVLVLIKNQNKTKADDTEVVNGGKHKHKFYITNFDVICCTTKCFFLKLCLIIPKEIIFYHMYAYDKQHLNSSILSPAQNGCHDILSWFIIEMANVLHLMGNASELDKLIQSFGKSIMIKKISILNFLF